MLRVMNNPSLPAVDASLDPVAAKRAEIANYERILREYGSGRWYDMGRRHLASLKDELAVLEAATP